MLTRELVILVVATAACVSSPDPRGRSIATVQRGGHGGWIQVTARDGQRISGELISVEPTGIRVLAVVPASGSVFLPKADIRSARLWAWETEHGTPTAWGLLGTASTVSHGYLFVLSAPVWLIVTGLVGHLESRASTIDYPREGWEEIAIWARFPQGMPAGLRDSDLIRQERLPPAPPTGAAPGDVAPPAGEPAAPPGTAPPAPPGPRGAP
jgi:hypothetical protein